MEKNNEFEFFNEIVVNLTHGAMYDKNYNCVKKLYRAWTKKKKSHMFVQT